MTTPTTSIDRRTAVKTVGTAGVVLLAGCIGSDGDDSGGDGTPTQTPTELQSTPTETETTPTENTPTTEEPASGSDATLRSLIENPQQYEDKEITVQGYVRGNGLTAWEDEGKESDVGTNRAGFPAYYIGAEVPPEDEWAEVAYDSPIDLALAAERVDYDDWSASVDDHPTGPIESLPLITEEPQIWYPDKLKLTGTVMEVRSNAGPDGNFKPRYPLLIEEAIRL